MRSCAPDRCWRSLLALGICLSLPALGWAQGQLGDAAGLLKAYSENATLRDKLFAGEEKASATSKAHASIAQASAQYFLYRVTHKQLDPDKLQKEFTANVNKITDKKFEKEKAVFVNLYGKALVGSMKNVLMGRDIQAEPTIVIHAARMLPIMARLKQDDICDYLVALIEDTKKTHDAVRLHALKALKETMPIRVQLDPVLPDAQQNKEDFADKEQNARRKRDSHCVDALVKDIERPIKVNNQSDVAVLRFLRREAIVSLASAGAPAVSAQPAAPALKRLERKDGLVAPTLMKVLAKKGGIQPPPDLQEKVEAALGLCILEYPKMPEYLPEPAIYLVGQTMVEFVNEYNKDWGNFTAVGADKKTPYLAWKTEGRRFEAGLKKMAENAEGNPAAAKAVTDLKKESKAILDKIIAHNLVDQPVVQNFGLLVTRLRPKTGGQCFKTLKVAEIPLD